MQLVKVHRRAFDVVVTGNMFGDILSDEASTAHRLHRHAALGQPERQKTRPVRAQPRQRPPTSPAKALPTRWPPIWSAAMTLRF